MPDTAAFESAAPIKYCIFGCGTNGYDLILKLAEENERVIIVDRDETRVRHLRDQKSRRVCTGHHGVGLSACTLGTVASCYVEQLSYDFLAYEPVLEHIIDVVQTKQNHGPSFDDLLKEWARLGGAMVDTAGRLSHHGSQDTDDSAKQAAADLHRATMMLGVACVGGLLVGVALALFITRGITRALEESFRSSAAQPIRLRTRHLKFQDRRTP